jgi:hypothetical protein
MRRSCKTFLLYRSEMITNLKAFKYRRLRVAITERRNSFTPLREAGAYTASTSTNTQFVDLSCIEFCPTGGGGGGYKICAKLQLRPSLHQFSRNSPLLRSAIPISTNISQAIWKVWVLRQRPYVKYDCH